MKNAVSVLIVGAGPTGLMLASQLSRWGISYRLIDQAADHTTQSRALVVQARSLELFDQMGIAATALAQGQQAQAVTVVVRGQRVLRMALGDVGQGLTRYPYLLMLEQSKTEQMLAEEAGRYGQAVERETELVNLVQDAAGVEATLRGPQGDTERVRADWLVGADGVHSRVRQTLGIPFTGNTYVQSLFVLDCEVSLALPRDEMMVVFSEGAFTGLFPLTNGRVRVLGTVPEGWEGQDTLPFAAVADTFATRVGMDIRLSNPAWLSVYHAHHRVVSTFRQGRCFLAGDAAHVHSPVGAQGMNTGLQDAWNLAWKLALVVQGKASESLLDTYHHERLAIARALVQTTDRAFFYVNSPNPLLTALRLHVMPRVLPVVWPLAQLAIHYRTSNLSGQDARATFPRQAPRPGERFPYTGSVNLQDHLDGTRFGLFVFPADQDVAPFTEALRLVSLPLSVITIPLSAETHIFYQRFGVKGGGYYLVRPDGYIAYRGQHFDPTPLLTHLRGLFPPST